MLYFTHNKLSPMLKQSYISLVSCFSWGYEKYSMLMLCILLLQIGHLDSQVANLSFTEQSWQQQAWPQGNRTVLILLSKHILHSSFTSWLSSMDISGPLFSALEVEAALPRLEKASSSPPIPEMECCLVRGVVAWEMDWIINPACNSKVSRRICSGVLFSPEKY